eukprot:SAG31_NODE_31753_length_364_cov_1.362264_1_plen_23_part_01
MERLAFVVRVVALVMRSEIPTAV